MQAKHKQYQGMTRLLMSSMVETRSDITFATFVISCFAKNPSWQYIEVIKTIIPYLKATKMLGIIYSREEEGDLIIKSYFDSDWMGDNVTKKSISRFVFMLNGERVSWYSKK